MSTVLFKALAFVLMIALGYLAKTKQLLQQEDSQILMKLIINITMPMALISGFRTFSFDASLLFALAIGFGFNLFLLAIGWLFSAHRAADIRALYVLNIPSYNIGNFALPFVQGFLPSSATLCLCMFDAGNNPIGTGITYSAAASLTAGDTRLSLRDIARKLFHSPPFLAYFIMLVLYLPGIRLPDAFFDMCALFGQGNTFLAMFTLGLIFEWHLTRSDIREVLRILGIRYILCLLAAAAVYLLTPFDLITRQTLCLCLVAPVTTLSVAYGLACGCTHSMIAALSSVSMAASFVLSLGLLIVWA